MTFPPPEMMNGFWQEPDFLLAELVSFLANKMEADIGITLMIRGTVFTGTLVSEREYLEAVTGALQELTRNLFDRPTKDEVDAIEDVFNPEAMIEDVYPEPPPEGENGATDGLAPEEPPPPIRYLHLREPVIVYPGATLGFGESSLPIMRLRLTEIDGWMLGRIMMMSGQNQDEAADDEADDPRRGYTQRRFIQ